MVSLPHLVECFPKYDNVIVTICKLINDLVEETQHWKFWQGSNLNYFKFKLWPGRWCSWNVNPSECINSWRILPCWRHHVGSMDMTWIRWGWPFGYCNHPRDSSELTGTSSHWSSFERWHRSVVGILPWLSRCPTSGTDLSSQHTFIFTENHWKTFPNPKYVHDLHGHEEGSYWKRGIFRRSLSHLASSSGNDDPLEHLQPHHEQACDHVNSQGSLQSHKTTGRKTTELTINEHFPPLRKHILLKLNFNELKNAILKLLEATCPLCWMWSHVHLNLSQMSRPQATFICFPSCEEFISFGCGDLVVCRINNLGNDKSETRYDGIMLKCWLLQIGPTAYVQLNDVIQSSHKMHRCSNWDWICF